MFKSEIHTGASEAQPDYMLSPETLQMIREIVREDAAAHLQAEENLLRKITAQRPKGPLVTPRRLAIVVIIAAIILEPWFLPTLAAYVALLIALVLLVAGRARLARAGQAIWQWRARRNPQAAETMRLKVLLLTERVQRWLDRLPKGVGEKIHLPVWQSQTAVTDAENAYVVRMAQLAAEARAYPYVSSRSL
ncbi:hypothetical protein NBRC116601_21250 [Cognatishimia sp. WU-CL00825]|uniref:hypothetical protein n=1 Tax=Cognatishimia sp. WU-CL00825 TaxID=3127658 RepID=UPI0031050DAB